MYIAQKPKKDKFSHIFRNLRTFSRARYLTRTANNWSTIKRRERANCIVLLAICQMSDDLSDLFNCANAEII